MYAACLLVVESDDVSDQNFHITDRDFSVNFDGVNWIVKWRWKDNEPVKLKNGISCYDKNITRNTKKIWKKEVERLIEEK